jgi:glucose-1-phosphate thymidylyltransferase
MTKTTLKVVIPMAGLGTRLRPHTWSKPKQLVSVAGKAVLDHVLDTLSSIPESMEIELVNIVGYLGDQIESYITAHYPNIKSYFVLQENPRGQSHAVQLAREYLHGPMLIVFADTLIDTDLTFLPNEAAEAIAWVKAVPDPRRFGFYYFKEATDLLDAIDEQMRRGLQLKGEYFLADAINIMLERGLYMRTQKVETWLDAGTPEAILETNRYLLEHGLDNNPKGLESDCVVINPPVFIHPTAKVSGSIIGPYVSLGAGCVVDKSIISDSILEDEAEAHGVILEESLVGRRAVLKRRAGIINAGDNTVVTL